MKKSLLAAAVLSAVSFGAYADGVELYGIADISVASASAQLTPDANFGGGISTKSGGNGTALNTVTFLSSGGIQGSRWGIKGSEDIGDGLKAVFQLESGINLNDGILANSAQSLLDSKLSSASSSAANGAGTTTYYCDSDTAHRQINYKGASGTSAQIYGCKSSGVFGSNGSTNGQMFGRTANVGLSDAELGTVKFGRNYVFMYDIYTDYDPVQFASLFSPVGASGTYGGGNGISENMRQDNSVKYTGKMGEISYGAMYKFGNVAGSTQSGSGYGFMLGYDKGPLGIRAAYQGYTDGVKGDPLDPTSVKVTIANTNAFLLAAKYMINDALTAKTSYQRYSLSAPSTQGGGLTAGSSLYNNIVIGQIVNVGATQSVNIFSIGGDYKLSDKLNLAIGYYNVNVDAAASNEVAALVSGSTTITTGVGSVAAVTENYASVLLDYKLSKRTDMYIGDIQATTNKASYVNSNTVAAGIRHKF